MFFTQPKEQQRLAREQAKNDQVIEVFGINLYIHFLTLLKQTHTKHITNTHKTYYKYTFSCYFCIFLWCQQDYMFPKSICVIHSPRYLLPDFLSPLRLFTSTFLFIYIVKTSTYCNIVFFVNI